MEDVRPLLFRIALNRRRLICARRHDLLDQRLQIVSALHKVRSQPIEQFRIPRLGVHVIDRLRQSPPHKALPEAIDDGAREAPVLLACEQPGGCRSALEQ